MVDVPSKTTYCHKITPSDKSIFSSPYVILKLQGHIGLLKKLVLVHSNTAKQRRGSARALKVHLMWATMIPFGCTRNASPFGVTHVGAHVHQQPKRQSYSSQGHWEG
jgi:hypothetical protein